ncbi:MAG TPA: T9SS type A sorting domain-containing protein [Flavisolibacter sp.]|jgi:hypothetical protein|nr:T9SS type A sorting domain-containing protein [Flavisolibacter sp.]
MAKFYMFLRNGALSLAFLVGGYVATNAQDPVCGNVIENFDNTSGSMAGFTGDLMLATSGTDGYLMKDRILASAVYSVTTPTYVLPNNASTVTYGFTLDGSQNVARVEVKVMFRSTLNGEIVTVFLAQFVPSYDPTTTAAEVCRAVSLGDLPGFPMGGQYRLRFELTSNTGAGVVGETITFDDFRTNGTFSQAPLPVTFIGFEAKKVNTSVLLTWKIAGEENVDRYEVERSDDGRSFTRIGQIQSHGKDTYTFSDDAPLTSAYYRIKNVDNDGSFKYSTIARIAGGKSSIVLRAFPQPVANLLTLQHPAIEGKTMVSIANAEGRIVKSVQPATGSMQTYVDMSSLGKGMYFIRISQENGSTETLKVLKQ